MSARSSWNGSLRVPRRLTEMPPHQLLADAVLIAHFGIVVFVVAGLAFVIVGNILSWRWVNGLWFRLAHLVAIAVVVGESWFGLTCPLTTLESWLRMQAGAAAYRRTFVEYWVQRVLFHEAPPWVFTSMYTLFGLLVVLAWRYFPPRLGKPRNGNGV